MIESKATVHARPMHLCVARSSTHGGGAGGHGAAYPGAGLTSASFTPLLATVAAPFAVRGEPTTSVGTDLEAIFCACFHVSSGGGFRAVKEDMSLLRRSFSLEYGAPETYGLVFCTCPLY